MSTETTDYTQRIKDYCDRHNLTEEDALFFFGVVGEAVKSEQERAAKIADERAAFNRRLARGSKISDTIDSRVADLKLTRADEAEVIANEIRDESDRRHEGVDQNGK